MKKDPIKELQDAFFNALRPPPMITQADKERQDAYLADPHDTGRDVTRQGEK